MIMHCDSLMAPQHPKNDIIRTIPPNTIIVIGTAGILYSTTSLRSSILTIAIIPTVNIPIPLS